MNEVDSARSEAEVAAINPNRALSVLLLAPYPRIRTAQTALLRAYGYRAISCASFDELMAQNHTTASCIIVDLHGLRMSPKDCIRRLGYQSINLPLILLSNMAADTIDGRTKPKLLCSGGPAFLLWQPIDVELFLNVLDSVTTLK